jgi:hypothetical protein
MRVSRSHREAPATAPGFSFSETILAGWSGAWGILGGNAWKLSQSAINATLGHYRTPFMVLRLTAAVVYCPCDTILPLQGDPAAF